MSNKRRLIVLKSYLEELENQEGELITKHLNGEVEPFKGVDEERELKDKIAAVKSEIKELEIKVGVEDGSICSDEELDAIVNGISNEPSDSDEFEALAKLF